MIILRSTVHDEFDGSDNAYLDTQYLSFRKRLVELYSNMSRILYTDDNEDPFKNLLTAFSQIENADNRFIKETMAAVAEKNVKEIGISSLLLVNRLFTQSCRMQIYGLKDVLLSSEQVTVFDHAIDWQVWLDKNRKEKVS